MNPNNFLCFSVTVATSTAPAATCWWTWRSQIQTCSSSQPGYLWILQYGYLWILEPGDLWTLEFFEACSLGISEPCNMEITNQTGLIMLQEISFTSLNPDTDIDLTLPTMPTMDILNSDHILQAVAGPPQLNQASWWTEIISTFPNVRTTY